MITIKTVGNIEKYCKTVDAKAYSYTDLHIRLSQLVDRSECPLCEGALDREMTKTILALVTEKIITLERERDAKKALETPGKEKAREEAYLKRLERETKARSARDSYIESHKGIFSKYARLWRTGNTDAYKKFDDFKKEIANNTPLNERVLFNTAFEFWSANSTTREDIEASVEDFLLPTSN